MRCVLGDSASGAAVVTGAGPDGFAFQSFVCVPPAPAPVLFRADHRGRVWPGIREAGRFAVAILAVGQTRLCGRFGPGRGRTYEGCAGSCPAGERPRCRGCRRGCTPGCTSRAAMTWWWAGSSPLETVTDRQPMLFVRGGSGVESPPAALPDPGPWGWGDRRG